MSRDTLPLPNDLEGPCPWCDNKSNFSHVGNGYHLGPVTGHGEVWVHVLECMGCHFKTVVVSEDTGLVGVHWYPAPGAGDLDAAVPADVASCFLEGRQCEGIGANRAAAVMYRSCLALFANAKGDEEVKAQRGLKDKLKKLGAAGKLHEGLVDWAAHLNQLGNEGAHPEDYDEVTAAEAADLGRFVRQLIQYEFEMPAQLLRARGLGPS